MKAIFSHGKESGPWGTKITRLAQLAEARGFDVESIDYTDTMDPDLRVERLLERLAAIDEACLMVGSSMGGYVSLAASAEVETCAVFLMAPALYIPGYRRQAYPSLARHIEIVHGWSDVVIPVERSIRYAKTANCSLHLISGDHALNGVLDVVAGLFSGFLEKNRDAGG